MGCCQDDEDYNLSVTEWILLFVVVVLGVLGIWWLV